jgi:hypothetical protein
MERMAVHELGTRCDLFALLCLGVRIGIGFVTTVNGDERNDTDVLSLDDLPAVAVAAAIRSRMEGVKLQHVCLGS